MSPYISLLWWSKSEDILFNIIRLLPDKYTPEGWEQACIIVLLSDLRGAQPYYYSRYTYKKLIKGVI